MTEKERRSFVIQIIRRATYKWKPRYEAIKRARVGPNQYKCAHCNEIFKNNEINADHIEPIVDPLMGWVTYGDYVERALPFVEGWQVLCKPCHKIKTGKENKIRRTRRKFIDKKDKK